MCGWVSGRVLGSSPGGSRVFEVGTESAIDLESDKERML